jgi:hypothetical protein
MNLSGFLNPIVWIPIVSLVVLWLVVHLTSGRPR